METDVLEENRRLAERNLHILHRSGVRSIDVMGSIGSGKTSLIQRMAAILRGRGMEAAAIAGDVTGQDDYARFLATGMRVINLNTGKECHLDAHLVHHAIEELDMEDVDVLFIENVGNLVCPADFPLGTDLRMVVISVTEGDDMIRKHPLIFSTSDVAVLNKVDLLHLMEVDASRLEEDYRRVKSDGVLYRTSAKTGEGIEPLIDALGL